MIHYIIQIVIFQLLFLIVYDLFFKKESFFKANRIYLILTPILSLLLPLIKISAIQKVIPEQFIITLPEVIIGNPSSETIANTSNSIFTGTTIWVSIWVIGMLINFLFFCFKLYKLYKLKQTGTLSKKGEFNLISLPKTNMAFSYFNTIFLGESLSEVQKESILLHEKVHVNQRHSLDLLFFEILRIISWFNPLVYMYQYRMLTLQEYIADANVVNQKSKAVYYQDLLSQVFQTSTISFINPFFNHSLIKKRIVMLQKIKTNRVKRLKYLLVIPIVFSMLIYTSCSEENEIGKENTTSSISEKIAELSLALEEGNLTVEERNKLLYVLNKNLTKLETKSEVEKFDGDTKNGVPFAKIDKVPTYPGCSGDNEALKSCMTQKISAFVGNEFNTKLANELSLTGRLKIHVQFKINKFGKIEGAKARAPHPALEKEALRIVNSLPTMLPGEQDGKEVAVLYSLPIVFEINE